MLAARGYQPTNVGPDWRTHVKNGDNSAAAAADWLFQSENSSLIGDQTVPIRPGVAGAQRSTAHDYLGVR